MDLGGSLSYHQWELLETSVKILRPFEEATGTISKDEASLSFVIPCVQALKATLGNLEADAAVRKLPDAEKLVLALKTQLDSRSESVFHDPTGPYLKAMFLDPRFKGLPKYLLSDADFNRLKESIITDVEDNMTEGHSAAASATTDPTTDEPVQSDSFGVQCKPWPRRATIQLAVPHFR